MKILRMLSWLIAALPVAAAGYWASFSARLPEDVTERIALGEVTPRWEYAAWTDVAAEPMHAMARLLHLTALQVPNATIQSVVWVNILMLLLILVALGDVLRRSFPTTAAASPLAFLVFGLLAASPAFGRDWLHGERVGLLAVPMLFVTALSWLQAAKGFAWRATLVILVGGVAPWFHLHGVLVATALLPAMFAAAIRAGSQRRMAWLGTMLLVGDLAAFFSMRSAGGLSVAGVDYYATIAGDPGKACLELLAATGGAWLDLWPDTTLDERVLGGASWLLPLLLLKLGNRSPEARQAAAPWWGCIVFGLLVVVLNGVRYDLNPPAGALREAMYGAFLLPIGLIGLLAARFGKVILALGAGAIAVLAVQDWYRGIEQLRLAHMRNQQVAAAMLVPLDGSSPATAALPVRSTAELALLVDRKWVPSMTRCTDAAVVAQFAQPGVPNLGSVLGGGAQEVRGTLRSSLRGATVQWLAIVAKVGAAEPRIVARVMPTFVGTGRNVNWRAQLIEPLADGAQVRAIALLVDSAKLVPMGGAWTMSAGKLVAAGPQ